MRNETTENTDLQVNLPAKESYNEWLFSLQPHLYRKRPIKTYKNEEDL